MTSATGTIPTLDSDVVVQTVASWPGPVTHHLGFEQVAAGGELDELEADLRRHRPDFYSFLTDPFTEAERHQFDL